MQLQSVPELFHTQSHQHVEQASRECSNVSNSKHF